MKRGKLAIYDLNGAFVRSAEMEDFDDMLKDDYEHDNVERLCFYNGNLICKTKESNNFRIVDKSIRKKVDLGTFFVDRRDLHEMGINGCAIMYAIGAGTKFLNPALYENVLGQRWSLCKQEEAERIVTISVKDADMTRRFYFKRVWRNWLTPNGK